MAIISPHPLLVSVCPPTSPRLVSPLHPPPPLLPHLSFVTPLAGNGITLPALSVGGSRGGNKAKVAASTALVIGSWPLSLYSPGVVLAPTTTKNEENFPRPENQTAVTATVIPRNSYLF